jgi:hypothetical protein
MDIYFQQTALPTNIYFQQANSPMAIYFTGGYNFNIDTIPNGNYGDITVTNNGSNWFINTGVIESGNIVARTVTFDKLPEIGAYKFLGRHVGTEGDIQEIGIDGGLEFHGSKLRRSTITGVISIEAGDGLSLLNLGVVKSGNLAARNVTFDKLIEFPAFKILGRPTGAAGDAQFFGIDASLDFNNGNLRRAFLTGDISASAGSNITSLATGIITALHFGSGISQAGINLITGINNTAQRNSLGLGSAAIANTGDFAAFSHTHPLSGLQQSSATTGQVVAWNGTIWAPATPSSSATDYQAWFAAGSYTWTNPSPTVRKLGRVRVQSGGGGGGSGRKGAAGTVRCGGGAGSGGGMHDVFFWTDTVSPTMVVVVGAGGAGGAAVTADNTNGNVGLAGQVSSWGTQNIGWSFYSAAGGNPGQGGTNATGTGGGGLTNANVWFIGTTNTLNAASASTTGGTVDPPTQLTPIATGGAPGGGITVGNVASRGGVSPHYASNSGNAVTFGSGAAGGGDGGTATTQQLWAAMGRGGGGGGASITGNAGRGGNGVVGCGGGGGGAALNGVGNSGAGGSGGDGMVEITVWL